MQHNALVIAYRRGAEIAFPWRPLALSARYASFGLEETHMYTRERARAVGVRGEIMSKPEP